METSAGGGRDTTAAAAAAAAGSTAGAGAGANPTPSSPRAPNSGSVPTPSTRSRPTNNQLLYKAYFHWEHYLHELGNPPPGMENAKPATETDACASVTTAFLQILAILNGVEVRRKQAPRNVLKLLSLHTRRTKVVELATGTHRVPEELRRHSLCDLDGNEYSTNLDRNRYGGDDNYLASVVRFNLEFLSLCPRLITVEIIDVRNSISRKSSLPTSAAAAASSAPKVDPPHEGIVAITVVRASDQHCCCGYCLKHPTPAEEETTPDGVPRKLIVVERPLATLPVRRQKATHGSQQIDGNHAVASTAGGYQSPHRKQGLSGPKPGAHLRAAGRSTPTHEQQQDATTRMVIQAMSMANPLANPMVAAAAAAAAAHQAHQAAGGQFATQAAAGQNYFLAAAAAAAQAARAAAAAGSLPVSAATTPTTPGLSAFDARTQHSHSHQQPPPPPPPPQHHHQHQHPPPPPPPQQQSQQSQQRPTDSPDSLRSGFDMLLSAAAAAGGGANQGGAAAAAAGTLHPKLKLNPAHMQVPLPPPPSPPVQASAAPPRRRKQHNEQTCGCIICQQKRRGANHGQALQALGGITRDTLTGIKRKAASIVSPTSDAGTAVGGVDDPVSASTPSPNSTGTREHGAASLATTPTTIPISPQKLTTTPVSPSLAATLGNAAVSLSEEKTLLERLLAEARRENEILRKERDDARARVKELTKKE